MQIIDYFDNEYAFLSNFYPCSVTYDNIEYQSSEAAFQAQKTLDKQERLEKFSKVTAKESKKLGRKVLLRSDWETVKQDLMYQIVLAKFTQNPELKKQLLSTGTAKLVEGNWWNDKYWGVCDGVGFNHLGNILMKVREQFNKEG